VVWKLSRGDEDALSTMLPLEAVPESRPQPWLLYMLEVNTMNFCSFATCAPISEGCAQQNEMLVAVPNTLASEAVSSAREL